MYGGNYYTNAVNMGNYSYVNGIEGAKAYQIGPRQTVLLMDSNEPLFYFKTSNEMGQGTIRVYKFEEITDSFQNSQQYVSKSDFDDLKKKLEEIINAKSTNSSQSGQ